MKPLLQDIIAGRIYWYHSDPGIALEKTESYDEHSSFQSNAVDHACLILSTYSISPHSVGANVAIITPNCANEYNSVPIAINTHEEYHSILNQKLSAQRFYLITDSIRLIDTDDLSYFWDIGTQKYIKDVRITRSDWTKIILNNHAFNQFTSNLNEILSSRLLTDEDDLDRQLCYSSKLSKYVEKTCDYKAIGNIKAWIEEQHRLHFPC